MLRVLPVAVLATAATFTSFFQDKPVPQNPTPAPAQGATKPANDANEAQLTDEFLATWMIVGNKNEIALAELAQKSATDPAVKAFAQKQVEAHRQFVLKLQPFAAGTGAGAGANPGQADGAKPDKTGQPVADQDKPAQPAANQDKAAKPASFASATDGFDHTGLLEELGAQCLQTSRKELDQKKGADFDRCYMTMEVGNHLHANDMLVVFQKHASAPLKAAFSEQQRMAAGHLAEAKAYVQKAETKGAPGGENAGK